MGVFANIDLTLISHNGTIFYSNYNAVNHHQTHQNTAKVSKCGNACGGKQNNHQVSGQTVL